MKKFKPKGDFKFLNWGNNSIEVATATDAEVEALRLERPETFNTYFEEVKADGKKTNAEPAPEKAA
jgi:hypothetical protein